jgi:hypothetical protein
MTQAVRSSAVSSVARTQLLQAFTPVCVSFPEEISHVRRGVVVAQLRDRPLVPHHFAGDRSLI